MVFIVTFVSLFIRYERSVLMCVLLCMLYVFCVCGVESMAGMESNTTQHIQSLIPNS